jgi:ABC-type polysaccharide/polyol phosphate transport system ATPase subunit
VAQIPATRPKTVDAAPAVVTMSNLSKRFVIRKEKSLKERIVNFGRSNKHKDDFLALQNLSLDIRVGETVGLIGHNGSGKSTLLKVIGGIIRPTSGKLQRRGQVAALLELGAGFHPDLTGRENIFMNGSILGLTRKQLAAKFDEIVEFSGIGEFIETQVKFYSSGMYVRLAFAIAISIEPDILLVDEVLAVGDEAFQQKCMDKIRQFQADGCAIVLVSHSAEQIRDMCDRVVVLEHGNVIFDGDTENGLVALSSSFQE